MHFSPILKAKSKQFQIHSLVKKDKKKKKSYNYLQRDQAKQYKSGRNLCIWKQVTGQIIQIWINFALTWGENEVSAATSLVLINLLTQNYSKH